MTKANYSNIDLYIIYTYIITYIYINQYFKSRKACTLILDSFPLRMCPKMHYNFKDDRNWENITEPNKIKVCQYWIVGWFGILCI